MFPTLIRRQLANKPKLDIATIKRRYPTKKLWPPIFSKLSQAEQLRFEKKYKRRIALAWKRPRWDKYTKIAQFWTITFVSIYCVFFLEFEVGQGPMPFEPLRRRMWNAIEWFTGPRETKSSSSSSSSSDTGRPLRNRDDPLA